MYMPIDHKLSKNRHQDRLREAEHERLARQVQAHGQKANPVYAPLLAKLGRQLVSLGEQLREQYEASNSLAAES